MYKNLIVFPHAYWKTKIQTREREREREYSVSNQNFKLRQQRWLNKAGFKLINKDKINTVNPTLTGYTICDNNMASLHTATVVWRMLDNPICCTRNRHLRNLSILAKILPALKKLVNPKNCSSGATCY